MNAPLTCWLAQARRAWLRWRLARCLDAIARTQLRLTVTEGAIDRTAMEHVRDALAHQAGQDDARLRTLWARWARLTGELAQ